MTRETTRPDTGRAGHDEASTDLPLFAIGRPGWTLQGELAPENLLWRTSGDDAT